MSVQLEVYDQPAAAGKDYILQVKIKNGPLLRAMRMRGYKNASQFCLKTRMSQQIVGRFLSLTYPPISSVSGTWRTSAIDLAKHLRLPPEVLFPEQHLDQALAKASGEIEISREDVAALIEHNEPADAPRREELCSAVEKIMGCLNPREERVLRLRHGFNGDPKTLDDISNELNVSRERVRQIEFKAYRKLKRNNSVATLSAAGSASAKNFQDEKRKRDEAWRQHRAEAERAEQARRSPINISLQKIKTLDIVAFAKRFVNGGDLEALAEFCGILKIHTDLLKARLLDFVVHVLDPAGNDVSMRSKVEARPLKEVVQIAIRIIALRPS